MPLSSLPGIRPISPVEEDLQRLFNEVITGFTEEEQVSEHDLENIYNGYTDEHTNDSNHLSQPLQPSMSHAFIAKFLLSSSSIASSSPTYSQSVSASSE